MNYSNLNDVEFEALCKDVMSRMLAVTLERFGTGKDGGIDLTDDVRKKNIVVQVKHYYKSSVSQLITSLEKETPKVEKISPQRYYICCSKELSPQAKEKICNLFGEYMESQNIITPIEIDDFLAKTENSDILRRHFKLWIESTNILTNVLTNDIFIDSEVLLDEIKEDLSLFVKTKAFDEARSYLKRNNILIIVGSPGVGKTITSKMLALSFAADGYRVRYTTDGANLSNLKKALSLAPGEKELILLDDCFGQAYFNMKETQANELLSLIKHVYNKPNKVLIMNSRVTIYQDVKARNENLIKCIERESFKVFVLNVDNMSPVEKAKIFYNHLTFNDVGREYLQSIKDNKNYLSIVKHRNYNPRIIEFVCVKRRLEKVEPGEYASFILNCLENPEQIWKNEYERRLTTKDRVFLTTLYSLTDTLVPEDMLKRCLEKRFLKIKEIDTTINNFEQSLERLLDSMIKIVDTKHKTPMISVANPSINDFLRNYIKNNTPEYVALLECCVSVRQYKRLLNREEFAQKLNMSFANGTIFDFDYECESQKNDFIAAYCAINQILDEKYGGLIVGYFNNPKPVDLYEKTKILPSEIMHKMLTQNFAKYYKLDLEIKNHDNFLTILENFDLPEQVPIINDFSYFFDDCERNLFIGLAKEALNMGVEVYCSDVSADAYNIDIRNIIDDCAYEDCDQVYIDSNLAEMMLEDTVAEIVLDEVKDALDLLPKYIDPRHELLSKATVSVSGAAQVILSYLKEDDVDYESYRDEIENADEIDYIFNH